MLRKQLRTCTKPNSTVQPSTSLLSSQDAASPALHPVELRHTTDSRIVDHHPEDIAGLHLEWVAEDTGLHPVAARRLVDMDVVVEGTTGTHGVRCQDPAHHGEVALGRTHLALHLELLRVGEAVVEVMAAGTLLLEEEAEAEAAGDVARAIAATVATAIGVAVGAGVVEGEGS